jgi:hypothetical protein
MTFTGLKIGYYCDFLNILDTVGSNLSARSLLGHFGSNDLHPDDAHAQEIDRREQKVLKYYLKKVARP